MTLSLIFSNFFSIREKGFFCTGFLNNAEVSINNWSNLSSLDELVLWLLIVWIVVWQTTWQLLVKVLTQCWNSNNNPYYNRRWSTVAKHLKNRSQRKQTVRQLLSQRESKCTRIARKTCFFRHECSRCWSSYKR